MNILTIKHIEDYVKKNDYVLIRFTGIGKNYVDISLRHKVGHGYEHTKDKPLIGRIYNEKSLQDLYHIYKVTKPMRFRYLNDYNIRYEVYYFFIEGLEAQLGLSGLNSKFFDEVVDRFKKQYEILKKVFQ